MNLVERFRMATSREDLSMLMGSNYKRIVTWGGDLAAGIEWSPVSKDKATGARILWEDE
jgi:hypothetical protein